MSAATSQPDLLPRIAGGDSAAVRLCIERYGPLISGLARRMLRADADDGVQEAFIAVWKSAARFDPAAGSELTFVMTLARRRLVDMVRWRGRRLKTESLSPGAESGSTGRRASAGAMENPQSRGSGRPAAGPKGEPPDRSRGESPAPAFKSSTVGAESVWGIGEVREEAERARAAMQRLREEERRVLEQLLLEGKTQTEVAEETGMPLGTVKTHARRGLLRLREMLSASSERTPGPVLSRGATP